MLPQCTQLWETLYFEINPFTQLHERGAPVVASLLQNAQALAHRLFSDLPLVFVVLEHIQDRLLDERLVKAIKALLLGMEDGFQLQQEIDV
jgi:hypothetical protein